MAEKPVLYTKQGTDKAIARDRSPRDEGGPRGAGHQGRGR